MQRIPAPATMSSLIAAVTKVPPANSSRITPAMMMLSSRCACMVSGAPDVHLDLVGDVHEALARVLVEHPVDLDCVAPGDNLAVLVREADLGAVERAGAHSPARGVLEHRLRAELERMGPLDPLARGEGSVVRGRLGLGRIEHAEQRREGGEVDTEIAVVHGRRAQAEPVLVSLAHGKIVILVVVADNVPEADRERVVVGRIGGRGSTCGRRWTCRKGHPSRCAARAFSSSDTVSSALQRVHEGPVGRGGLVLVAMAAFEPVGGGHDAELFASPAARGIPNIGSSGEALAAPR